MIDSYLRSPLQKAFVDSIAEKCASKNISPLFLTFLGCCIGISCVPLLYFDCTFLAILAILTSGYIDILDGTLARLKNVSSPQGAVLDIVCDRTVEASIVFSLFLVDPMTRATSCLLMLISILICVTSFLVVGIFIENESSKSFHYSPGLMERSEAFSFFIAMIAAPQYFNFLSLSFTFLVLYTGASRVFQFMKNSKSKLTHNPTNNPEQTR